MVMVPPAMFDVPLVALAWARTAAAALPIVRSPVLSVDVAALAPMR